MAGTLLKTHVSPRDPLRTFLDNAEKVLKGDDYEVQKATDTELSATPKADDKGIRAEGEKGEKGS